METHGSVANVVLGVTGSIAAYKACDLASRLRQKSVDVKVIMTESAQRFVTPLTFQTVTGNRVYTNLFMEPEDFDVTHIGLGRWADLLVIAPASARVIGTLASGVLDDLLTCTVYSVTCPVLIAPAMNQRMYTHPIVQQNLDRLRQIGYHVIAPAEGFLACGEVGPGRLPEIEDIVTEIDRLLNRKKP